MRVVMTFKEDMKMKRLSVVLSLILGISLLTLTVNARESKMMPGHPGLPDDIVENSGDHHRNFKVGDLDADNVPEIIVLVDETLIVMDNQGEVIFTKEVDGIEDNHDGDHHHVFDVAENEVTKLQHSGVFPVQGNSHHTGSVSLEIADIDMDGFQEIIILDSEKLIVLDNSGNPKLTIPIPEIESE